MKDWLLEQTSEIYLFDIYFYDQLEQIVLPIKDDEEKLKKCAEKFITKNTLSICERYYDEYYDYHEDIYGFKVFFKNKEIAVQFKMMFM